jgi:hypothetical protein
MTSVQRLTPSADTDIFMSSPASAPLGSAPMGAMLIGPGMPGFHATSSFPELGRKLDESNLHVDLARLVRELQTFPGAQSIFFGGVHRHLPSSEG